MMRWLRRLIWLGVLVGAGCGAYQALNRRRSQTAPEPQWPPMPAATTRPAATMQPAAKTQPAAAPAATASKAAKWVEPVNGECPEGYPIKANDNSRIFHVPGGRFYDRTVAERCYASADDAVADGYRPAKA